MFRKISLSLLWLGFSIYAFVFAPPPQPETWDLIKHLSLGQWSNINPLIIALFNLMGILPIVYACVLLVDSTGQKLKAWPFVVASFGVGAFAILPYLAFRQSQHEFKPEKGILINICESRWLPLILSLVTVILLFWAIIAGDWTDFIRQWQTSRFINVMSLDFCLLCLLFPTLIKDDLAKRKIDNFSLIGNLSFIPLLGALLYLCLRPPLFQEKLSKEFLINEI